MNNLAELLNHPLISVVIGGLISIVSALLAARASIKGQRSSILLNEKISRYYAVADLLQDLDDALENYGSAPIRINETVDQEEAERRDLQGVNAFNSLVATIDRFQQESRKLHVIGSKEVVRKISQLDEGLESYLYKAAIDAAENEGHFDTSMYREAVETLRAREQELLNAMNRELSD